MLSVRACDQSKPKISKKSNMVFLSDQFCSEIKRTLPNHFEWLIYLLRNFRQASIDSILVILCEAFPGDPLLLPWPATSPVTRYFSRDPLLLPWPATSPVTRYFSRDPLLLPWPATSPGDPLLLPWPASSSLTRSFSHPALYGSLSRGKNLPDWASFKILRLRQLFPSMGSGCDVRFQLHGIINIESLCNPLSFLAFKL